MLSVATAAHGGEPITALSRVPEAELPTALTTRPVGAKGSEPPVPETWVDFEHRPQVLEARDGCFVAGADVLGASATLVMPDTFRLMRVEPNQDGPVLVVRDGYMDGRMQTHVVASHRIPLAIVARSEQGGGIAYAYRTTKQLVVIATFGSPPPPSEIPECRLVALTLNLQRRGGDQTHVEHAPHARRKGTRATGTAVRLDASTSRVRADAEVRLAVTLRVDAPEPEEDAAQPSQ